MANRPSQRLEEKEAQVTGAAKKKVSAIPANALRPKDHMPAKADVEETLHHPTFEFDGVDYTITADTREIFRDVDFLEAIQVDDNVIRALRMLIGIEQWMHVKAKYRDPETNKLVMDEKDGGPIVKLFAAAMDAAKAKNF